MLAYICLKPANLESGLSHALMSEKTDDLVKFSAPLTRLFADVRAWATNLGAGRVLSEFGDQMFIEIPLMKIMDFGEFIKSLEYRNKVQSAVGVGMNPAEAFEAMQASYQSGSAEVVMYSSELNMTKSEGLLIKDDQQFGIELPNFQLDKPEPASNQQAAAQDQNFKPKEEAPKQQGDKTEVVQALTMLKQQASAIAMLKDEAPEAYNALKKVISVFIKMAQGQFGDK